jgi:hypothetical protein
MRSGFGRWFSLVLLGVAVLPGCDTGTGAATIASSQPQTIPPSTDPQTTAATIGHLYPLDCKAAAASWKWATCHDQTKGFDVLLACTTAARDQAKAAAAELPPFAPANPGTPCAAAVAAKSNAFVTNTATYLDDLVTWLGAHKATLVGPMRNSTIWGLSDDKLKEGMPHEYDKKYGGDEAKGESLRFGWVNDIACTKSILRCGTEEDPAHKLTYIECGVQAAAIRLGVDCGTSSPFHHADGKRYCPSAICDLNDPRAWLYDRATGQRVQ